MIRPPDLRKAVKGEDDAPIMFGEIIAHAAEAGCMEFPLFLARACAASDLRAIVREHHRDR